MSGVQYGACGAAASERRGVVVMRGGGAESVGTRTGEAERWRCRETERRRLGRKKIFFENNFVFSEIRVIFVRS